MTKYLECPHLENIQADQVMNHTQIFLRDFRNEQVAIHLCEQCTAALVEQLLDERLTAVLDQWAQRTFPRNFFRKG